MNQNLDADVAVVGAGLSGLTAAAALRRAGVSFYVLEAGEQLGGRVRSARVGDVVANLGAEWIGTRHRRMRALADGLGLHLKPTRFLGAPLRLRTGRADTVSRVPAFSRATALGITRALWQARRLARPLSPEAPWRTTGAETLDRTSFGDWLKEQGVAKDGYRIMDAFIGDLVSRPISDLSLLHVAWWVRRNDGPVRAFRSAFDARVLEGSQELARRLAAPFAERISLGAPVSSIEQTSDQVVLTTTQGDELRARRAIFALPATRLLEIAFEPALDPANRRLATELAIGPATKIVGLLSGDMRSLPRVVVGGTALTNCWRYRSTITGFARPPQDELDDPTLIRELAGAFGARADEVSEVTLTRWAQERHIGGCDVCFRPGQLTELGPLLRSSHGLVRFSGPERSSWPNNMEGAVESGEAAAEQTIRSLVR